MKYYIIFVSNNSMQVDKIASYDNLDSAKVKFHDTCKNLWNAQDVERATVAILDTELNIVDGYKEIITHSTTETTE